MSRLDELIKEYCPDGVEYKKLGNIATISRGGNFQKKDFCENGIPCIHYGQIYTRYGLFTDKTISYINNQVAKKQKYAETNDIIMAVTSENIEDICKCVAWLGNEPVAVSGHTAIIHHNADPKYLTYYFHTEMFFKEKRKLAHGTKVMEVTPDKLSDISIPLPPVEVQREIVKILDEYTASVTALQQELNTELTARRKQYEYYRDKLLSFDVHGGGTDEVEWRTLEKLCYNISSGKNKEKETYGAYPVYGSTGIIAYCNKPVYNSKKILLARVGANAGYVQIADGEYDVSDNTLIVSPTDTINYKYLYYQLKKMNLRQFAKGGGQPLITAGQIKKICIPVPSKTVQEKIVSVLDNFDAICSDLSIGLPAEIEARQKQYEYYRDKLLSFKEL